MKLYITKVKNECNSSTSDQIKKQRLENKRYVEQMSWLMLKQIIYNHSGRTITKRDIGRNRYGKPFLKGITDLHFNISHSGCWIVTVVDNMPIGVDVELILPVDYKLIKNFLSDIEYRDLMDSSSPVDYFYDLWTLKESYIKAVGKGLSIPLDSFMIRKSDGTFKIESSAPIKEKWFFKQYDFDKNYKLSLCAMHDNFPSCTTFIK